MTTTNRTLQFLGAAYGNSNVTITATIDNVTVFNGTVTTLDEEIPAIETVTKPMPVLFAVENSSQFPTDFAGAKPMSITVSGGNGVILDTVLSNYTANISTIEFNVKGNIESVITQTPGNATSFVDCYTGTPTNSEGTKDCRSSVAIGGVVQVPDIVVKSQGIWTWAVNSGNTITCNLNVSIGNVG
jgi:hypothetical protein